MVAAFAVADDSDNPFEHEAPVSSRLQRTASIRAVDDKGNYYDVDHFIEHLDGLAAKLGDRADAADDGPAIRICRVNRQPAKQIDDGTYEVIATGLKLRRVTRSASAAG
ncbi:MAG: hypothetical protein QM766_28625 [Burkholderiaceae bacterium]